MQERLDIHYLNGVLKQMKKRESKEKAKAKALAEEKEFRKYRAHRNNQAKKD